MVSNYALYTMSKTRSAVAETPATRNGAAPGAKLAEAKRRLRAAPGRSDVPSSMTANGSGTPPPTEGGQAAEAGQAEPESEFKRQLEQEQARNKELVTRLAYAQADFENYRKRTEREAGASRDASLGALMANLLSVLDELDLAVSLAESGGEPSGLLEGVKMVRKNLTAALKREGLERIEAEGKPFDPALHEAVEKVAGDAQGDEVVAEEVRPGYVFRGQVLRPSMVKVKTAQKEGEVAKR